jgi:hypothetical protein
VLKIEKTFHGASLMQIKQVTIYSSGRPGLAIYKRAMENSHGTVEAIGR